MRKHIFLFGAALVAAACASPRYTYNFDHYNYNSGKAKQAEKSSPLTVSTREESPLALREQDFVASTSLSAGVSEAVKVIPMSSLKQKAERYKNMSKQERRDFKKEVRTEVRNFAKEIRFHESGANIAATHELDDELKLAIIFGAVGITLVVLGGINTIFWVLGVVGLVIGLVFFIRWISTQ